MENKRGQFFILAALIISLIIFSLGTVVNYAKISQEPQNFYDLSYEAKREAGSVIDYEIYNVNAEKLDDFVKSYSELIQERDPDTNAMFIYGNNTEMKVTSLESVSSTPTKTATTSTQNKKFKFAGWVDASTREVTRQSNTDSTPYSNLNLNDLAVVNVGDTELTFPVTEHTQFIVILQKDVANETYVSVE